MKLRKRLVNSSPRCECDGVMTNQLLDNVRYRWLHNQTSRDTTHVRLRTPATRGTVFKAGICRNAHREIQMMIKNIAGLLWIEAQG